MIAFSRSVGPNDDIYVMNADGSGVKRITRQDRSYSPAWSPDGTRIVFVGYRGHAADLYSVRPNGGDEVQLTFTNRGEGSPDWSPDGAKIVFDITNAFGIRGEIWVMNPDGSGLQNLTTSAISEERPAWSPDGTKIAFEIPSEGEVFTMAADGTGKTSLTSDLPPASRYPDWQPLP